MKKGGSSVEGDYDARLTVVDGIRMDMGGDGAGGGGRSGGVGSGGVDKWHCCRLQEKFGEL